MSQPFISNVPVLEETFQILAKNGNWFNNTHNLNICEGDLIELLTIASKDQLFQFSDDLCEQIDNVAMGSPVIRTTNGKHIYHYAPSRINLHMKTNFPTSTRESSMLFSL